MRHLLARLGLIVRLLLALGLPGAAHADDVQWITDSRGCKVADLAPQDSESISWTGECERGLANGEGILTWFMNGVRTEIYEGMMVDGYAEGMGRLRRAGGMYFGEWKRSMQHGRGRFDDADGSWYQGEWSEGLPHGRGQMLTPEGKLLRGYWNNGVYEEEGAMPKRT